MVNFSELGLKKNIVDVINSLGFKETLEVQEKIIPLIVQKKNVAFTSRTGSGKTLAFSVPYLTKINKKLPAQMMVVLPTRELCIQVGKVLSDLCQSLGFNVGVIYGGRDIAGDYKTVAKKNHIIVGTPGRLIKHINEKALKVGEVKYIVFDECDQMFSEGFEKDCIYIRKRISKDAQIILASATMTPKVREFVVNQIPNVELLSVGSVIPENIVKQKVYCDKNDKNDIVLKILKDRKPKRTIIFCNTKMKSYNIAKYLITQGYKSKALNGDFDQNERIQHFNMFKSGRINILVTTDVAARGLHVNNLDVVINYDVSKRPEFYVHRIGRTGRTDKKGYALNLICPEDEERILKIEHIFNLNIEEVKFDTSAIVKIPYNEEQRRQEERKNQKAKELKEK